MTVILVLQVSWLRHTTPIPQLMALNNLSNSRDSRIKAMVGEDWSEFVLMIRSVAVADTGQYECQVSGRNHTTSSKRINLNVIGKLGPDTELHSLVPLNGINIQLEFTK